MPPNKPHSKNINQKKDTHKEQLKRAIAHTVKAIAKDQNIKVDFIKGSSYFQARQVHITEPSKLLSPNEISIFRGRADSISLMLACHNEKLHNKFAPKEGLGKAI